MSHLRRWFWPIAIILLVTVGFVLAFRPQPLLVDTAKLVRAPLTVTLDDDGVTRIREVYVVAAPIPGRLLRVEAHVGDAVIAHETVLATLAPSDPSFRDVRTQAELEATARAADAARAFAAAELTRQEADRDLVALEFERTRRLFEQGHASAATMDRSRRDLRMREAAVATARAALRQRDFELQAAEASLRAPTTAEAERERRSFVIRSPVSGRVLRVHQESESVVGAGARIMEIGDPSDLEIVIDLLSRDAVRVTPGDAVRIERWGGNDALNARVRWVEPFGVTKVSSLGIEEQRVNVIIDLIDPRERWERLGHGYQVDARIVLWHRDNVLQVPQGALFRREESWSVFRVEADRAQERRVVVGQMNDRTAQVVSGLAEGDVVVLHPSDRVRDGARVTSR